MSPCPKRRWPTLKAARRVLRAGTHQGRRMRAYYCAQCRGFHLTRARREGRKQVGTDD